MDVSALLTSAGINIALCAVLFLLYSLLRKQPSFVSVYFGQKLAQVQSKRHDPFGLDRLFPSTGWILKAWQTSEEDIFAAGGFDAVVFIRMIKLSIRIFSIAAIICIFLVLPLNYFGNGMQHKHIPLEALEVFTILNVKKGSRWLWAHCLALYLVSCCACFLLYFEYKSITKMRLEHITKSPLNPSQFTVLVRGIPWSSQKSYSDIVKSFFTTYYASSYLSHQMVYRSSTVQKLVGDAQKVYKKLTVEKLCGSNYLKCSLCGGTSNTFKVLSSGADYGDGRSGFDNAGTGEKVIKSYEYYKECSAALVFFRTRYAALIASQTLQSANPMLWVTDSAPEPQDIYWKNLFVPHRLFWIRRIATLMASVVFMFFFLVPVTVAQGLVHLDELQKAFPFMRGILNKRYVSQLVTGYLPSVILLLFLIIVPPIMMVFSTVEGAISRSGRKKSTCLKVLYFLIWNVFVVNILSGTAFESGIVKLNKVSNPKDIPYILAKAVPATATFFMTYVLTSGWVGLSCELIQPLGLLWVFFSHFILRNKEASFTPCTFPYHTEIPRVLLFGLLGFSCSILAPLILPLLLVYFFLAFLVYQNQIVNVYVTRYQSGLYWPIVHNTTIFSLVLTQILVLGVFGLRESSVASSITIPLIIGTLLFNEYCRKRFQPVFKDIPATVLIEMDSQDERRVEEIHERLLCAYCQFPSTSYKPSDVPINFLDDGNMLKDPKDMNLKLKDPEDLKPGLNLLENGERLKDPEDMKPGLKPTEIQEL